MGAVVLGLIRGHFRDPCVCGGLDPSVGSAVAESRRDYRCLRAGGGTARRIDHLGVPNQNGLADHLSVGNGPEGIFNAFQ
ncbi:MAG: hypothetical protein VXX79_15775, partial [Pseudomonadota bacterium]|nr:hypothetical protein [Pseudomonadota bacterium]